MKRRLGFSLYPNNSDINDDKNYIDMGEKYGFSRIFMSMLEITDNKESIFNKFKNIIDYAKKKGYEVILDVAPNIFDSLDISYDDLSFFHNIGADGIRLDVAFDSNKEAMLTYNEYGLIIELNMSNDVDYLNNILTYKPNKPFIYGCHNFYPQSGSALPLDFFTRCSERFKKEGIRTSAFISSQSGNLGPWDINDGLPTIEMHRKLPIEIQAKHLFATELIDDVIIGNAYASEEELKKLGEVDRYQVDFEIELVRNINDIEKDILFKNQHFRRGDITNQMIRSTEVRKKYKSSENIPHDNKEYFQRGDIVIGNNNFGKYKNELQIVLQEHKDNRKNKVGRIKEEELILLNYIAPWSKFKFNIL